MSEQKPLREALNDGTEDLGAAVTDSIGIPGFVERVFSPSTDSRERE